MLSPALIGTLISLVSAVLYTLTNVCLQQNVHHDPIWATFFKVLPTVFVALVAMAFQHRRGVSFRMSPRAFWLIVLAGLTAHWAGNVVYQLSLGFIGLAPAVTLAFGSLIAAGALQSRYWLGERFTLASGVGMLCMIAAIGVLSFGTDAQVAARTVTWDFHPDWHTTLGIAGSIVAGVAFSFLGTTLRWAKDQQVPSSVAILIIGVIGIVTLGAGSVWRVGLTQLAATPQNDLFVMLAGGMFNALGFILLGKAFELAPVVRVNAANSTQTAMSALASIAFFGQSPSGSVWSGVVLTLLGLWLINKPAAAIEAAT